MPLCAAMCRCSQSRRRKYALLLGTLALSQAEGRRFAAELRSASASRAKPAREPGLALQQIQASSRSYAQGLFGCDSPFLLGAAGVPFGAVEVEKTEIGFLFSECVRVDSKRQLRVRVAKLCRDPANALRRGQRQARDRVSAVMKSKLARESLLARQGFRIARSLTRLASGRAERLR